MDALVTDAHIHSAVWGIRALGRAGVRAVALGPDRAAPGLWSRHAAGRVVGPYAERDPEGYARAVASLIQRRGPLVVYPSQEESIDALLAARAELPAAAVLPYPPSERLASIRDKRSLAEWAAEYAIATPATVCEATAAELRLLHIDGPCVVKPVRKSAMAVARVVRTNGALRSAIAGVPPDEPLIVQRHAEGGLMALSFVMSRDGRLVASFQQRARRTWPPEAGPSSLAVSVPVDDALSRACARLLAGAGFFGLIQLQFVGPDASPLLIDANPRFYGSLPLALAAGVNLPALWHAVVVGGELPPSPPLYRAGVTYRHLEPSCLRRSTGGRGWC